MSALLKQFSLAVGASILGCGLANAQDGISPQDFATAAAQSDAYEISAARIAQIESQDSRIRTFAAQMIGDHTATTEALRQAVSKSHLSPAPEIPNVDQQRMLSGLQSVKGRDFDDMYITQQVVAHQGALAVEQQYKRSGTDSNLKRAADTAIPMIRHHLEMALQLKAAVEK